MVEHGEQSSYACKIIFMLLCTGNHGVQISRCARGVALLGVMRHMTVCDFYMKACLVSLLKLISRKCFSFHY